MRSTSRNRSRSVRRARNGQMRRSPSRWVPENELVERLLSDQSPQADRIHDLVLRYLNEVDHLIPPDVGPPMPNSYDWAPPMPTGAIAMLPSHKVSRTEAAAKECCMVCMGKLRTGDHGKTLPCFHTFHVACIDAWLCMNAACPICRHRADDAGFVALEPLVPHSVRGRPAGATPARARSQPGHPRASSTREQTARRGTTVRVRPAASIRSRGRLANSQPQDRNAQVLRRPAAAARQNPHH